MFSSPRFLWWDESTLNKTISKVGVVKCAFEAELASVKALQPSESWGASFPVCKNWCPPKLWTPWTSVNLNRFFSHCNPHNDIAVLVLKRKNAKQLETKVKYAVLLTQTVKQTDEYLSCPMCWQFSFETMALKTARTIGFNNSWALLFKMSFGLFIVSWKTVTRQEKSPRETSIRTRGYRLAYEWVHSCAPTQTQTLNWRHSKIRIDTRGKCEII